MEEGGWKGIKDTGREVEKREEVFERRREEKEGGRECRRVE